MAAPYLRDSMTQLGILSDTFETAITWDRFDEFHAGVMEAARSAVGEPSNVTCRFTHVYPDGPAPYFTVLTPARRGSEIEQWDGIKAAVSEVLIDAGGRAVAPGFINMLSWATESLIEDGRGLSDTKQGVTLEVFGEGWSMGPLDEKLAADALKQ